MLAILPHIESYTTAGTGKTSVARRLGLMFKSLGVLPNTEVNEHTASDFETGFTTLARVKEQTNFFLFYIF